jgi:hypothetical protein
MKNIILAITIIITIITVLFSCTKENVPGSTTNNTQNTLTTPIVNTTTYNFEGVWSCNNWVVDQFNGTTRKRSFIFSNQTLTNMKVSLNQYTSNGSFTQLFTSGNAIVDSNYFDNHTNTIPIQFKGVLTSDTTLMVYEYQQNGLGAIDTIQIKEFIR